jgi:acyl-coenzyme A synthetase/AMP-(fatty) acid ligase
MAAYQVDLRSSAKRELYRLDRQMLEGVVAAIDALADEPRPVGIRKLASACRYHQYANTEHPECPPLIYADQISADERRLAVYTSGSEHRPTTMTIAHWGHLIAHFVEHFVENGRIPQSARRSNSVI